MKYLILFTAFFVLNTTNIDGNQKIFVGYINKEPIFDSFKEKKLYKLIDNRFVHFFDYSLNYIVLLIKNNYAVYSTKSTTIVSCDGKEISYPITTAYASINEDGGVYVTDKNLSIKLLDRGKILDTGIKGYVVSTSNDFLYYCIEHDSKLDYANADLYRVNLKNTKDVFKVASNISGESVTISTSGKFFYDEILYNGRFVPAVFSIEEGKYNILSSIKSEYLNSIPYYSSNDNYLIFYNTIKNNFNSYSQEIPTVFNFKNKN